MTETVWSPMRGYASHVKKKSKTVRKPELAIGDSEYDKSAADVSGGD
ncbi:MAG: hypothetical protein PHG85_07195 [Candidatus Altiarchaeota archaeon]|nr:hypothetical protein [Candidatus Altiarchaeota archaeon]